MDLLLLFIQALRTWFAQFGLPEIIVTDNGPGFASEEFEAFVKTNEKTHNFYTISSVIQWTGADSHRRVSSNKTSMNFVCISYYTSVYYRSIPCSTAAW